MKPANPKTAVLGDGGWGTALATVLARKGTRVALWGPFPEYLERIRRRRENDKFLPGVPLSKGIEILPELKEVLSEAAFVIVATPSQFVRSTCSRARPFLSPGTVIISGAKGLESETLKRMSEVITESVPGFPVAVISGPSHAEEVARNQPATVVAAAADPAVANRCQELLIDEMFRIYTHEDVLGVELSGALKTVISIAAGISDGLGFGDNTKSALLTRGMVEIARLGTAMGADPLTFWGLSGIGDLMTSGFSPYGRNLQFGRMIGKGTPPARALAATEMVIEGYRTAAAAWLLGRREKVELPIINEIYLVLYENKPPLQAVHDLMTREPKDETIF